MPEKTAESKRLEEICKVRLARRCSIRSSSKRFRFQREAIMRWARSNSKKGGGFMRLHPKWWYRTRVPKISTGKKIEWIPLIKIERDEEQPEGSSNKRMKKKRSQSETPTKIRPKGDPR
jgi:hypothetical protein